MSDPDSDIGPAQAPQDPPAKSGVAGALAVAALLGAVAGFFAGLIWLPDFMAACAFGGAMTGAALRVAVLMSPNHKGLAKVEDEDGTLQ